MENNCPCGSNLTFEECCNPIIEGTKQAETAQSLMRSRYSAYEVMDAQYLIDSTHFSTKSNFSKADIETWAKESSWQKLEIISTQNGLRDDDIGKVEFKAYYKDSKGIAHIHHEKSSFKKEEGRWFFVDGNVITPPKITIDRNTLCVCGSGKKFKKCCGG
ncbi:MAG: YchJ family protein [Arcicella sp.]|nr:YchJ family protein [Arcicella sp.]